MDVKTHDEAEGRIIGVSGDIDLYSSPQVREAILAAVKEKRNPLVVNLEGVTYIDSSGVATLVEGLQLTRGYEGAFRLSGLSTRVREVFELARLEKVFAIYNDVETALTG